MAPPGLPPDRSPASAADARRKWYVLASVSTGAFLATVMATSINVATPTLVRVFATDFAVVQWVVLAYLMVSTTLLLSIGRLADMLGKKPLFVAGFVIFTLGSLLCPLSPTVYWLIGFRVVQGLGAALLTALSLAIVTETFPDEERGKAIGVSGSILSSGIVIGPTLGGFLVDALSWQWVFLVNVPIGVLGTLAALRFIPASPARGGQRFDLAGAALLFVSLIAALLALTLGQQEGFGSPRVLGLFSLGILSGGLFIVTEAKVPEPMLELTLFRNTLLSIGLVTGLATFVAISGTIFLMPFYLEGVLGYPPRQVGVLMAIVPVVLVVIAPISGALSDRFGSRLITVLGLALILSGYLAVGTLDEETTALGYVLRFLPLGLGMGTFQAPNNSAIMGAVPKAYLGVAGGLLTMTRTFGATAGIAALGALWATRVALRAAQEGGPSASAAAQVAGLQDMFVAVQVMILLALLLSLWGLLAERRTPSTSA
ncbi:MFS transporter [soil metagenome]